ncbi:MAG: tetratricopeptide repeat protein [Vicinamibacterales bacterium]
MTGRPLARALFAGLAAALVSAAGCAARTPHPALPLDIARADALVREGCYRCLLDALAIYEPYLAGDNPPDAAVAGAVDVLALVTVREKEVGLPYRAHLERARLLAAATPAPPTGPSAADLVGLAALVPEEPAGYDPDEVRLTFGEWRTEVDALRGALGPEPGRGIVATYIGLAIDCGDSRTRGEVDTAAVGRRFGETPLIAYRLAICARPPDAALVTLMDEPRWDEAAWFAGRRALAVDMDVALARTRFARAADDLAGSPAVLLSLAGAEQALSEFDAALAHYDALLAIEPRHRDGRLGRAVTLTYLERHAEAVADATRLIELGTYLVADAYYWRAFNRYRLGDLEAAWADVQEAEQGQSGSHVPLLAGLIAYGRHELDTAKGRFRTAALDRGNCDAPWYLGHVLGDQGAWSDAASALGEATACFRGQVVTERDALERLARAGRPPDARARESADRQRRLAEAERRRAEAAYAAAAAHARLGHRDEALRFADEAASHETKREKAEVLKRQLGG